MIDTLEMLRTKIESQQVFHDFGLAAGEYGMVTMHRPSNVDDPVILKELCGMVAEIAEKTPLIFPIHPRTRQKMEDCQLMSLLENTSNLFLPPPINYLKFMNLVFNCRFVITDSGGIQEETSYLGIPCLTVRKNTERPVTVTHGTNQLCDLGQLKRKTDEIISGNVAQRRDIELWDGKAAVRILEVLRDFDSAYASGLPDATP
jgi:UDP-N-acetylglucosamine 2-epimerase (non-hydrolysing)